MAAELIRTPDVVVLIHRAIIRGLQQGAQIVRNYAVLNVTGRVLKRDTGHLARTIHTFVTETGGGGILRVGTQTKYGAYWEHGFSRGAFTVIAKNAKALRFIPKGAAQAIFRKKANISAQTFAARPWLRPAADQALPEITRRIRLNVERELGQNFAKSVTIEIKVA
jgi:hypothetical protein